MKKYLLILSLFFFIPFKKTYAQDIVSNGASTTPITFPAGSCVYTWANNNTSIGLPASGTGNIPSFKAVNTGSSPVTATIVGTPVGTGGFAYIVNSGSNNVSVINTATNAVVATVAVGSNPNGICVDPNYNEVYVVNNSSNTVSVINTLTNTVTATIPVGPSPWSVSVSPDGSQAFVSDGGDNNVEVINTTTNTIVANIPAGTNPNASVLSPNGGLLYVNSANSVLVINTTTQAIVATIPVGSAPQAILITPDGSKVYSADFGSNNVYVINTATNTVAGIIPVGVNPGGGSMSPDGSVVYIANLGSNSVSVISTATNTVTKTIPVGSGPWGVSVRPDGTQIYVSNSGSNSVSVVDASTNAIVATIAVGSTPYSFGSFFTGGMNCTELVKYTITVNPASVTPPTISATTATGTISACAGTASVSPQIQQFTVSGSGLTSSISATAPAGFEVSLTAGSGYSNRVIIPQAGGTVSATVVYVRSAAAAPTGGISGNVTLTSAGASNQTVAVTGTVNALPTVNAVPDQIVNNGAATTAVNFTGTGNTFNWVNNTPGIGLATSGSGNITSFTAVNNGSMPIKATVTVTSNAGDAFAYVTNYGNSTVSVINTTNHALVATIPVGSGPFGIAVSLDGSRVYVTNRIDNTISVINTSTNTVIATIPVGSFPWGVSVGLNDKYVYVTNSKDNTVSVIDNTTNTVIKTINVDSYPIGVAPSPDGTLIFVACSSQGTISVISTITNTVVSTIPVSSNITGIVVSPDGSRIYVANSINNAVYVIDATTYMIISTVNIGSECISISISPDGSRVYTANQADNTVSVINTSTNQVILTITTGLSPTGISVTSDAKLLYVTNQAESTVSVISSTSGSTTSKISVGPLPISFGNFITSGTGCDGAPITFTITVNPGPPTITAGTATGTISSCAGSASVSPYIQQFTVLGSGLTGNITATAPLGFEVSLAVGSGYGSNVVLAQASGSVSNTIVYVRSAASLPNGSTTANVILSSPGAPSQTVSVTGLVNPNVTASLVISASENNVCAGTTVTFTATPTNGGSSPVYQWLVNGSNAGTNSSTFSSSTFANGDVVSCMMTSSAACVMPANITSNSVTMNVTPDVIPSITIVASQNTICAGTLITFTAMPINGGPTPVYQWLVNGNNAGTNSAMFSGSNFADGDIVSCVMTANAACAAPASVTSNSINMSVSPLVSPAISIAASANNICLGTNVTFAATPGNGGSSPVYQWVLNGNNTGSNSPTFSSSTLANGDIISCRISSNAACLITSDATSNNITVIVNPAVAPTLSINISANNICAGTQVTFTATPTNGGSSPVYQWLLNGNNAGTNGTTFSISTLANGDAVSCVMTSSLSCTTPSDITSNSILMNIFPLPVVNGGGNKTIEKGSSVALTATASGNVSDITWSPATGLDNNKILTPQASPTSTTLYTITVQTAAGCTAADSVTVTVLDGIIIPNTFTPNGDGINDTWDLKNLKDYQNCVVLIFDRYGGEVYSSKGYYTAWDGTLKGRRLPTGTYYYIINLNDGTPPLSGFVALIR